MSDLNRCSNEKRRVHLPNTLPSGDEEQEDDEENMSDDYPHLNKRRVNLPKTSNVPFKKRREQEEEDDGEDSDGEDRDKLP